MDRETLVMTGTFRAETTPALIVRREEDRILHYLCALVSWAQCRNVARVIFGENSNTRFDFSTIVRYLESAGKDVEILVFDGNKEAAGRGKGFGEGEILEYVFNNSRLLRHSPAFYKVTGRLFVSNFEAVSESTPGLSAFKRTQFKSGKPPKANTAFFKCSIGLFERELLHSYKRVDESRGVFIEHVYFDQLRDVDLPDFAIAPAFVGQQASTGKVYAAYDPGVIEVAASLMPGEERA